MIRTILIVAAVVGSASPAFAAAPCPGRNFVAQPLRSGRIDPDAQPEPKMVYKTMPLSAISFPVMPGKAERQHDGLVFSKAPKPGGAIEVLLAKPDTGYQLRYLFRPSGTCWTLTDMQDEAL